MLHLSPARPPVGPLPLLVGPDHNGWYAAIGVGKLQAFGCTVTADGLPGEVSMTLEGHKPRYWLTIIGKDGEAEGDPCELRAGAEREGWKQAHLQRRIGVVDGSVTGGGK